jgi:DNA-binding response OmpR family regulator
MVTNEEHCTTLMQLHQHAKHRATTGNSALRWVATTTRAAPRCALQRGSTTVMITVLVADDEPMIRRALADMLNEQPGVSVIGVARDRDGAVALAGLLRPTVAVLDVRMPGGGAEAARQIGLVSPRTRLVAHSAFDDRPSRTAMLAAGAGDYIVKGTPAADIVARVLAAAAETRAS